jgi:hypothetical protein
MVWLPVNRNPTVYPFQGSSPVFRISAVPVNPGGQLLV